MKVAFATLIIAVVLGLTVKQEFKSAEQSNASEQSTARAVVETAEGKKLVSPSFDCWTTAKAQEIQRLCWIQQFNTANPAIPKYDRWLVQIWQDNGKMSGKLTSFEGSKPTLTPQPTTN
jgi:hypothetical protein